MEISLNEKLWENEDIERGLRQLPTLIASKSVELVNADASVKQMKHAIALVEAATTIAHSSDKKTATELKARGYQDSAQQRMELINLEKEYAIRKAEYDHLRDTFDAIRKQANIYQEELRQSGRDTIRSTNKPFNT